MCSFEFSSRSIPFQLRARFNDELTVGSERNARARKRALLAHGGESSPAAQGLLALALVSHREQSLGFAEAFQT